MKLQPLSRVESQDPLMRLIRRRITYQVLMWSGIIIVLAILGTGLLGLALAPVAAAWIVVDGLFKLHHHTQIENFLHFRQLEALMSLHALINIRQPLPPMRLWAISPDFATLIAEVILNHEPRCIVELGSGASTLISAYCLEQLGTGYIYAFDHGEQFASETRWLLSKHGLTAFTAIIHAPLIDFSLPDGSRIPWYNTEVMNTLKDVDLLIVDGPPGKRGTLSRYPALLAFYDKLSDDAHILVDDYLRPAEHEMVNLWLEQLNLEVVQRIPNEKGAIILRKCSETSGALAPEEFMNTII